MSEPIARGGVPPPVAVTRAVEDFARVHGLSRRETQVVLFAARGLATKAIASELGIGYKTVSQYWTRACQKVRCSGHAELLAALLHHALEASAPPADPHRR